MRARTKKGDLLRAFNHLCDVYEVTSAGFDREKITAPIDGEAYDGKKRWAMHRTPGLGWMVVCGKGGCGVVFTRACGYVKKRWDFLMLMEALSHERASWRRSQSAGDIRGHDGKRD